MYQGTKYINRQIKYKDAVRILRTSIVFGPDLHYLRNIAIDSGFHFKTGDWSAAELEIIEGHVEDFKRKELLDDKYLETWALTLNHKGKRKAKGASFRGREHVKDLLLEITAHLEVRPLKAVTEKLRSLYDPTHYAEWDPENDHELIKAVEKHGRNWKDHQLHFDVWKWKLLFRYDKLMKTPTNSVTKQIITLFNENKFPKSERELNVLAKNLKTPVKKIKDTVKLYLRGKMFDGLKDEAVTFEFCVLMLNNNFTCAMNLDHDLITRNKGKFLKYCNTENSTNGDINSTITNTGDSTDDSTITNTGDNTSNSTINTSNLSLDTSLIKNIDAFVDQNLKNTKNLTLNLPIDHKDIFLNIIARHYGISIVNARAGMKQLFISHGWKTFEELFNFTRKLAKKYFKEEIKQEIIGKHIMKHDNQEE